MIGTTRESENIFQKKNLNNIKIKKPLEASDKKN